MLNDISPFSLQEKWDNCGINIRSGDDEVQEIVLSLDIDEPLIEQLSPNSLLITHHPIIFNPLSSIDDGYPSHLLKKMIKRDISHIALHTNFDKTHLNDYVLSEILDLEMVQRDDFVVYAEVAQDYHTLDKLFGYVQKRLKLPFKKIVNAGKKIERLALTTGSGGSLIREINADVFLTGDIKYHDALMAKCMGLSMIEIGHFESERYFVDILSKLLFDNDITHRIIQSGNPFEYV